MLACLRELGRLDEAEALLAEALDRDRGLADLHYQGALLYQAMGKPAEARARLDTALEIYARADPEILAYQRVLALDKQIGRD